MIVEFRPPTDPLEIVKAFLDVGTAVVFGLLVIVVLLSARRYPVLKRRDIFYSLLLFAVLGTISTAMDALDEWFWFVPSSFYNEVWKPLRLSLFLIAIFILVFAFERFYRFSERLFGED
ncbi:MAG: hypothetical protein ACTSPE_13340 [Candidatus Thorarchaeota archaeon]